VIIPFIGAILRLFPNYLCVFAGMMYKGTERGNGDDMNRQKNSSFVILDLN